jgi:hypothetical protein
VEAQRPDHVVVEASKDAQRREDAQKHEKRLMQMWEQLRMMVRELVEMLLEAYERWKRAVKAARCERLMGAHERDQRPMSSNKLGQRPMESNRCGKRPMDADESDERPMSANKCGKRPVKTDEREERPLEANKGVSRDQAVREANIEQLEYIFACWRSQLDGRLDESGGRPFTHRRE